MRGNPNIKIIYRLDFANNKGTLGFVNSEKQSRLIECNMIGFETIGRLAREAFEEVHGKSELVSLSTMRREEYQARNTILVLHPYWKLGIFEISIKS